MWFKMATAAPSPLESSVEKTNGAKLCRLLIDGGTTVLRKLFDQYHPPAHLVTSLNSHYGTLVALFEDRHLHAPQWHKLFLLLTNICGLSPPRGEWHKKPLPGDHSREANLARIKFFRNDLYGHVSTTGIDTPTFNALWGKISGALRGLGLDKAEIDRLKAERGGEEHYIDLLCQWSVSEQDINSQLEDIRQSLQHINSQLEDIRQSLQDIKAKLDDVHKFPSVPQKTIYEVRQTQLEERETIDR